jgi:hypothetical protein
MIWRRPRNCKHANHVQWVDKHCTPGIRETFFLNQTGIHWVTVRVQLSGEMWESYPLLFRHLTELLGGLPDDAPFAPAAIADTDIDAARRGLNYTQLCALLRNGAFSSSLPVSTKAPRGGKYMLGLPHAWFSAMRVYFNQRRLHPDQLVPLPEDYVTPSVTLSFGQPQAITLVGPHQLAVVEKLLGIAVDRSQLFCAVLHNRMGKKEGAVVDLRKASTDYQFQGPDGQVLEQHVDEHLSLAATGKQIRLYSARATDALEQLLSGILLAVRWPTFWGFQPPDLLRRPMAKVLLYRRVLDSLYALHTEDRGAAALLPSSFCS